MATISKGNVLQKYVEFSTTVTITPGSGGSVRFDCSSPVGVTRPSPRTIYSATEIVIPGGSTFTAEAFGADATYTDDGEVASLQALVSGDWIWNPADGVLYVGPALASQSPITQAIVKSDTLPAADKPSVSTLELQHNGSAGYILHMTQGPNMGASAALIGLGIDEGGRGLFVNNKKTGIGIVITQNSTISSPTAYGMLVNGGKGSAPAVFMQQNNDLGSGNAQSLLVMHAYQSFSSSQKIMEWRKPDGTTSGTLAGWIRAEDGALIVQDAPAIVSGGNLSVVSSAGSGGSVSAEAAAVAGSGANIDIYNTGATANKRRFRWTISADLLVLSGRNDAGGSTGDLLYAQNTTKNIGLCGYNSYGGGSAVVGIPNAATVPSSNPTGGGVLYAEGGALKWRGSSGTITTLGAA